MVRSRGVVAGKYFVNSTRSIAREVLDVRDDAVIFISYHLDTGTSTGNPKTCMKQHFTHWADHEATKLEIAGLQRFKV